jgi:hypothetical protein
MKIKILASMLAGALAMLPVTANAGWGGGGVGAYGEPITIYGWQYHSFESVEKTVVLLTKEISQKSEVTLQTSVS